MSGVPGIDIFVLLRLSLQKQRLDSGATFHTDNADCSTLEISKMLHSCTETRGKEERDMNIKCSTHNGKAPLSLFNLYRQSNILIIPFKQQMSLTKEHFVLHSENHLPCSPIEGRRWRCIFQPGFRINRGIDLDLRVRIDGIVFCGD